MKLKRRLKENETVVSLNYIKIPGDFKRHMPNPFKISHRRDYYNEFGEFKSPIVIDNHMYLKDGYITYLLCKEFGFDKINVIFE